MKRWLWFSFLAGYAWFAPLSVALAAPAWVHFAWQRPVGSTCPPREVLEREVEQALGGTVFTSARAARLSIFGTVDDAALGVVVRLRAQTADGEPLGSRELRAPPGQCAALRHDISLVLTLLIDRHRLAGQPSALRVDFGLWGGLTLNLLPRGSFGAGATLAFEVASSLQLRVAAGYWLPVAVETTRGIRAELQASSVTLRACPRLLGQARGPIDVHLCAGAQLGALFASQTYPKGPATQVRLLAQGLAELRGAVRLWGASRLELAAGPVLSLNRTRLLSVRADGVRVPLYRVPLLGMIVSLAFII